MADLFGDFIPDEWIQEVFEACEKAPWHKYLFLTKNPLQYERLPLIHRSFGDNKNWWFGQTLETLEVPDSVWAVPRHFISIEPLLREPEKYHKNINPLFGTSWVIIGQQTNPTIAPPDEWVQYIINQCREANVPVFIKEPLYKKFPIQEFPKGLEVKK
jgi:protein gp37